MLRSANVITHLLGRALRRNCERAADSDDAAILGTRTQQRANHLALALIAAQVVIQNVEHHHRADVERRRGHCGGQRQVEHGSGIGRHDRRVLLVGEWK